jgi:cyanophycinase
MSKSADRGAEKAYRRAPERMIADLGKSAPLLLVGGAEDRESECVILREFMKLCGGPRAHVSVVTVATEHPQEVGGEYEKVFQQIGCKSVDIIHLQTRQEASLAKNLQRLEKSTGLFFTGGNQTRIAGMVGGTEFDWLLRRKHRNGMPIGGTSAGAVAMSSTMILGGRSGESPLYQGTEMCPGMEFIPGVIIESHFSQRGRHGRLLSAVAQYPHDLGLGIDEDTAMLVKGNAFQVIGSGSVTIIDVSTVNYTNLTEAKEGERLAFCGIQLHVLPAGHYFSLSKRRRIPFTEIRHKNGHS